MKCGFKIRIHRHRRKISRVYFKICFYLYILISKNSKGRGILVDSFFAYVLCFLPWGYKIFSYALNILLGKLPVLHQLTKAHENSLSGLSSHFKGNDACYILSKIQYSLSRRGKNQFWICEAFLFGEYKIIGRRRSDPIVCHLCFSPGYSGKIFPPCVVPLSILVIRKPDRTLVGPVKRFIRCNNIGSTVSVSNFHLGKELDFCAIIVLHGPGTHRASVPTICQHKS